MHLCAWWQSKTGHVGGRNDIIYGATVPFTAQFSDGCSFNVALEVYTQKITCHYDIVFVI